MSLYNSGFCKLFLRQLTAKSLNIKQPFIAQKHIFPFYNSAFSKPPFDIISSKNDCFWPFTFLLNLSKPFIYKGFKLFKTFLQISQKHSFL